jgi:DNA-binding NarL/FixJ family response regulator
MKRMNVGLTDDNPVAGREFRGILEHQDDRQVVGEAKATSSGAMGDLIENASAHSVCKAIREVELGSTFFSPSFPPSARTEPERVCGSSRTPEA